MIPATASRVAQNTAEHVNARIEEQTRQHVDEVVHQPQLIAERLEQLDREWDVERFLETNAATVALVGLGLGAFVDRRFFVLPAMVAGFLLQHAVQGWCPPVPIIRRMGFRTQSEIERERYALKALRGDFERVSKTQADQLLAAVDR